jgi:hypothetical protein
MKVAMRKAWGGYEDTDISLLMASRNNHGPFRESVDRFASTCTNPERVEFLVKVDSDDDVGFYRKALSKTGIKYKIVLYDKMDGYNDLHVFYNDLWKISNGKILWMCTDDVVVDDGDWFAKIMGTRDVVYSDNIYIANFIGCGEFFPPQRAPAITKELANAIGYVSPYRAWDKYLNALGSAIGRRVSVDGVKLRPSSIVHARRGGISHKHVHMLSNRAVAEYIRDVDIPKLGANFKCDSTLPLPPLSEEIS